jgi:hypothetical protein
MKKSFFLFLIILFSVIFLAPNFSYAQDNGIENYNEESVSEEMMPQEQATQPQGAEETFEAKIIKILDQK